MNRKAPIKTHQKMIKTWKLDPEFKAVYDELEMEFTLLRELLLSRQRAGLTQAEVAKKMGTKPAGRDPFKKKPCRTTGIRQPLRP